MFYLPLVKGMAGLPQPSGTLFYLQASAFEFRTTVAELSLISAIIVQISVHVVNFRNVEQLEENTTSGRATNFEDIRMLVCS